MKYFPSLKTILSFAALVPILMFAGCSSSDDPNSPAAVNLAKGKEFLAQNGKKEGVITLDNGIEYKVLVEGGGKSPKLTDVVVVHSIGRHLDGSVFTDSYADGKPEEVLVKYAMLGWKKVLPLMSVGGKWRVWIPPHMAFSNRGVEGMIEPNETIEFDIELKGIKW